MNIQVLLGLLTFGSINQVIFDGTILNMLNEKSIGYSFLLNIRNEFHQHSSHLIVYFFNNQHTYQLFLHGIDENTSIIHMELGCIGHECIGCQLSIHNIVLVHALHNQ